MPKTEAARRAAIEAIVDAEAISTQEELRRRLADRGFEVSQSTLSRDIRRLGLVKRPAADGGVFYTRPRTRSVQEAHTLGRLLPDLMRDALPSGHLLVVKTLTGAAQTVAAALDDAGWPEVVGTIAGDDTVLIVLRSSDSAEALADRVRRLARLYD
ncbi:MAG: arginine repressor [marine benthic group bacterium]|jgi:transcriptional regulator of arginine metabolism|nr:arginine repressor [Gemmatimonadota bacterium]MCL7961828.1 arginine repressor [Candidatus Carthagonibacter metallireducens]MCL7938393.1 arginine repressor [Gemmatimonadota bacterium]MCL7957660.1 arginine repressor [Gemmatimonadota bacterium]MCL7969575.1 arginine repressor [Gemmatimonadota bacterium]